MLAARLFSFGHRQLSSAYLWWGFTQDPLQWCHNERGGVSNHRRLDCLLNRLFSRRSKKTSRLRGTGFCEGNPPVTGGFPSQRVSNAENVSMWWRLHVMYWHIETTTHIFDGVVYTRGFICQQWLATPTPGLGYEKSITPNENIGV